MRKIIQIAVAKAATECSTYEILVALCEDGTVWERRGVWVQVEPIPDQKYRVEFK